MGKSRLTTEEERHVAVTLLGILYPEGCHNHFITSSHHIAFTLSFFTLFHQPPTSSYRILSLPELLYRVGREGRKVLEV